MACFRPSRSGPVADLATRSDLTVYFQSRDSRAVREVRQRAEAAAVLGHRVFVEQGSGDRIHLADNLAELVVSSVFGGEREALRVLHPRGKALLLKDNATRIKEPAIGVDDLESPVSFA